MDSSDQSVKHLFFLCLSLQGEGLCFPEDHWSDANAVLENGFRGDVQR